MKKTKIEVIEKNSITNEPTFSLLPNLLDENELSKISGGEQGLWCGEGYGLSACAFFTQCGGQYQEGNLKCTRGYENKENCQSA